MDNIEINLINTNDEEMIMPDASKISSNTELISHGAKEAISGTYVKEVLIPDENTINLPNYLIDLGSLSEMTPNQMGAISSLLTYRLEDSDTYIYISTTRGIYHLGMANKNKVDSLISVLIQRTLGDEIKVYRNVTEERPGELVKSNDITKVRLNL